MTYFQRVKWFILGVAREDCSRPAGNEPCNGCVSCEAKELASNVEKLPRVAALASHLCLLVMQSDLYRRGQEVKVITDNLMDVVEWRETLLRHLVPKLRGSDEVDPEQAAREDGLRKGDQ